MTDLHVLNDARDALTSFTAADHMGLSLNEYRAILALFVLGGALTAGDLSLRTNLTTGAITGVIDRLERLGFVTRSHYSPTAEPTERVDRRRVFVNLTDKAYKELRKYYE